jgi:hypothetical protein
MSAFESDGVDNVVTHLKGLLEFRITDRAPPKPSRVCSVDVLARPVGGLALKPGIVEQRPIIKVDSVLQRAAIEVDHVFHRGVQQIRQRDHRRV